MTTMRLGLILGLSLVAPGLLNPDRAIASIVLYDATLGDRPGDQPWLLYADDSFLPGTSINQTVIPGVGTRLTSNNAARGGYSNRNPLTSASKNDAFPDLDRQSGFSIEFDLQILAESHSSNDRAGFSVIVISDDLLGIELGFWDDEIWAQNDSPLFTRGEGAAFDATDAMTAYSLRIVGSGYRLFADENVILDGMLRDYSGFGLPPYTLRNFLYFGDNTTSAGADVVLGSIRLTAIPEPGSLVLGSLAIAFGLAGRSVRMARKRG